MKFRTVPSTNQDHMNGEAAAQLANKHFGGLNFNVNKYWYTLKSLCLTASYRYLDEKFV